MNTMDPNMLIDLLASLTVLTSPVSWFYALPQFINTIEINKNKKENKEIIPAIEFILISLCCESWMFYCSYLDSPKQVIMNLIPTLIFLGYSVWADMINSSRLNGIHFIMTTFIWGLISHYTLNQQMNGMMGGGFQIMASISRIKQTFMIIDSGNGQQINIKSLMILLPNQMCWMCDGLLWMDPFMIVSRGLDLIVSLFQILVYFLIRPDSKTKKQ